MCATVGNPAARFDAEPSPAGRWRLTSAGLMVRDGTGHYLPHERMCRAAA